jgi:hypothetical protein
MTASALSWWTLNWEFGLYEERIILGDEISPDTAASGTKSVWKNWTRIVFAAIWARRRKPIRMWCVALKRY